jgi:hypothetical protein
VEARDLQPALREDQAGPNGVAERSVVPQKPGNAGGGKGPWFKVNAGRDESRESDVSLQPPSKAQKLQAALHAKAKASSSYRERWLDELAETVDAHARQWFRRWLRCRRKTGSSGRSRCPGASLDETLEWAKLSVLRRRLPWANA